VFLDHRGRRHRRVAALGVLAALLAAVWGAGLVAGPVGFSAMPALPSNSGLLPNHHPPAARVSSARWAIAGPRPARNLEQTVQFGARPRARVLHRGA
jgi:hypothetical protein